ncbi:MAG: alpha/beta hydrolase [Planctomycetaceae bacterium]
MQTETLGGLRCHDYHQLPEGATPELCVVLCHGFGAPGTDLVGLAPEILLRRPQLADTASFYFPEAPLSLEPMGMPGGRAWWMLDVAKLNAAITTGEFRDLRNDHPEELPAARAQLTALIDEVRRRTGLPMSRIVMGGFSQGSMLSIDVALRLPEPPALLTVFSGTLLGEDDWRERAADRGPMTVLQSHGDEDMILPFQAAEWLRDLFVDSGFDVEFIPFHGPHTIPAKALHRLADRLAEL